MSDLHKRGDHTSAVEVLDGVAVSREEGLLRLELARPVRLNALAPDAAARLRDIFLETADDESVRAILLTGRGRGFCSGADLTVPSVRDAAGEIDAAQHLIDVMHPLVLAIREVPRPVVAAIQGPCVGIGVGIALACDLVVASTSAYLLLPFVKIGLALDGGVSALLVERVGLARAAEMCMLGERVPAELALRWGLINKVVPDADLADAALDLARGLAQGPTVALASIKEALSSAALPHFRDQLDLEADLQRRVGTTADYAAGRGAFAEKTVAQFEGK